MIWLSFLKNGTNIGMMFVDADDLMQVYVTEEEIMNCGDTEIIEGFKKTPQNVFMTKEEMEKYIPLEKMGG